MIQLTIALDALDNGAVHVVPLASPTMSAPCCRLMGPGACPEETNVEQKKLIF